MSPKPSHGTMNFALPSDLVTYLSEIDSFIATSISPLQASNDNERFFDHRREYARTDWHNQGLPRDDWEDLLAQARNSADEAGFYRFCLPEEFGGQNGGNLWMAVIRMHLAKKGLGLFNDLQNEHSIVGNFPDILMVKEFGTEQQKKKFIGERLEGKAYFAFGLTEPNHGSDATHMCTRAEKSNRNGIDGWSIDGAKMWISGMHRATHCLVFARTDGAPGFKVKSYEWTFNMPTDHASLTFTDVFVPDSAILGQIGYGLPIAQTFVHENRLRQAASSLGAAEFCIEETTQAAMLKLLILKTATEMNAITQKEIERDLGDKVSMCNVNKDH
ncbi:acyl-CoA dehydrogenase-like protein [Diplocarpon rosae]|nr:acyl-CoA dehydrogenase-like protein [Diplocarpon rosae]